MSRWWAYKKSTLSRKILRPLLHVFEIISQISKIFKICKCPTEVCILSCVFFICKSTSTTTEEFNYFCILSYDLQNFHIHKTNKFCCCEHISLFKWDLCRDVWCDENEVDVFAQSRRSTHKLKQFSLLSHMNAVTPILEGWIKIVTFNKASYMHTINKIFLT